MVPPAHAPDKLEETMTTKPARFIRDAQEAIARTREMAADEGERLIGNSIVVSVHERL